MKHKRGKQEQLRRKLLGALGAALVVTLALAIWGDVYSRKGAILPGGGQQVPLPGSIPVPVTNPAEQIPPYFDSAEAAMPFPALLSPELFSNYPLVARAYEVAAEIAGVIAQQPCYCHCEKFGHRSLLDCYSSQHGAG
jgi:hypothetical protein